MSLKISQIKDFFSSFSKLEVGGIFYIVPAMSLILFFFFFLLYFFLFFSFLTFAMGGATSGRDHSHAYIHCILQRYNKSVRDIISQKPHLFFL